MKGGASWLCLLLLVPTGHTLSPPVLHLAGAGAGGSFGLQSPEGGFPTVLVGSRYTFGGRRARRLARAEPAGSERGPRSLTPRP